MRYFLGLRPPSTLLASVLEFRKVWGGQAIEPHITVKAPCGLGASEAWLETVQQVCQAQPAFSVSLEGVGSFGTGAVFLRANAPNLISFHQQLLQALGTSAADQATCFEGMQYIPHLSLVHLKPITPPVSYSFSNLLTAATEQFGEPVVFQPLALGVYRKEEGGEYKPFLEIPLGKAS